MTAGAQLTLNPFCDIQDPNLENPALCLKNESSVFH